MLEVIMGNLFNVSILSSFMEFVIQTEKMKFVFYIKLILIHDDVIQWKHVPCYWPFMRGIHQSLVNSLTKASDAELWYFLWFAPE